MFKTLTRTRTLLCAAGLSAAITAPALGQPGVLNHVPEDQAVYVVMPNLGRFLGDLNALAQPLAQAFGEDAQQMVAAIPLAQLILNSPGLDANGSAAIVIDLPEGDDPQAALAEGPDPDSLMIMLPVTDFAAFKESPFIQGQNQDLGNGLLQLDLQMAPQTVFMRDLDGFAVVGLNKDRVSGFDVAGNLAAHGKMLGGIGALSAESSDVMFVANINQLGGGFDTILDQLEEQAQFAAMMAGGAGDVDVDAGLAMIRSVVENFANDADTGVIGIDMSADGIGLDIFSNFKAGSTLGKMFDAAPNTEGLMEALPAGDYVFAAAQNNSGGPFAEITKNLMEADALGDFAAFGQNKVSMASPNSYMLAPSPPFGGAGLFANSVSYIRGRDANALKRDYGASIEAMDGVDLMEGMSYSASLQKNAISIDGVDVDTYSTTMSIDAEAFGGGGAAMGGMPFADPNFINTILFGPSGGPSGYIAAKGNGVFVTGSKNSELLQSAFTASGGGASLADNEMLQAVRGKMPAGRTAEAYLNLNSIFEQVLALAQMMGGQMDLPEVPAMPPVGGSATVDDGGMLARVYVPTSVITTLAAYAEVLEDLNPGGALGGPQF